MALLAAFALTLAACSDPPPSASEVPVALLHPPLTPLLEDLEQRTFNYFWETSDRPNALVPDRFPYNEPFSSIAAVGFGLTAYAVGVERGWITREQARERTLTTLRFFRDGAAGARRDRQGRAQRVFLSFPRTRQRHALRLLGRAVVGGYGAAAGRRAVRPDLLRPG